MDQCALNGTAVPGQPEQQQTIGIAQVYRIAYHGQAILAIFGIAQHGQMVGLLIGIIIAMADGIALPGTEIIVINILVLLIILLEQLTMIITVQAFGIASLGKRMSAGSGTVQLGHGVQQFIMIIPAMPGIAHHGTQH